jgi:hypothetical protein
MVNYFSRIMNALNDGHVDNDKKYYKTQFDKCVYFASVGCVVVSYGIVTFCLKEFYVYVENWL